MKIGKKLKRIKKGEKGAITILVLTTMLFMLAVVGISYINTTNKGTNQNTKVAQIEKKYIEESNDNAVEQAYNEISKDIIKAESTKKTIKLIPNITEWTNQDVVVTVNYGSLLTQNRKAGYGSASTENATTVTVTENGTVYAEAQDSSGNLVEEKIDIKNIDKTLPTVTIAPNGGVYAMPTQGTATIKTTLTAKDEGGSGLNTLQYAWSTSNASEPSTWIDFVSGNEIIKTDCTQETYYLWTKVTDVAENRAENTKVSGAFTVGDSTNTANKITLKPSTTDWTNQDVEVTVNYGENLTQNRKAGVGQADTENATTVTVTENGTVYAEAQDSAGNKITAELEIKNIEKVAPTITIQTNQNTTWSKTSSVEVTISDTQSGLLSGADIKYGWSTSNTVSPSSYTQATLNYQSGDTSATFIANSSGLTGKYYLWVVPTTLTDKAGNSNTTTVKTTGTFYLDNTAPTISISEQSNTGGTITLLITANDSQAINYILLPDGTKSNASESTTYSTTYSISQAGTYEFKVVDMATNEASDSYTAVFQATTTIDSLSAESPSSGTYKSGQEITMTATFSENIYADSSLNAITSSTAIPLKIKFGNGQERTATFDNISGTTITYKYTIQEGDNGLLYLSSYTGRIYNDTGLYADLSATELTGNTIIADTQAPNVTGIQVTTVGGTYSAGTTINIQVTYDENIYADEQQTAFLTSTAPILKLEFDEGIEKTVKFESISGNLMNYSYIISQEDSGTMKFTSYNGVVYDIVGNMANISLTNIQNTGNAITAENSSTENAKVDEIVEDYNKTIVGDTPNYKNPVIPVGYAAVETTDATWTVESGTDYPAGWNNGLVIRDEDNNQYVWVPVDGTDVKYAANYSYPADYSSTSENTVDRSVPDGVINQEAQVERYGGYYIARYEAGDPSATSKRTSSSGTSSKPVSKAGMWPYTFVTITDIKNFSETAYNSDFVQSGLVTGKQWDTMCLWLSNAGFNVTSDSSSWGNYHKSMFSYSMKTTGSSDTYKSKNLYDIAGNVWELSSEWYINDSYPYVKRGGTYYWNINGKYPAAYRMCIKADSAYVVDLGFRTVLYIY